MHKNKSNKITCSTNINNIYFMWNIVDEMFMNTDYYYWASEASPTLTSTIEIKIPCARGYIYIQYMSRKLCGTLLRESATYCVGVTECSEDNALPHSQTPYLNVAFG